MKDHRFPDCKNAQETERAGMVKCAINAHGGLPHVGVCKNCKLKNSSSYIKTKEIKYQEEVLERMVKLGCKSCEKRRQEEYIEQLRKQQ